MERTQILPYYEKSMEKSSAKTSHARRHTPFPSADSHSAAISSVRSRVLLYYASTVMVHDPTIALLCLAHVLSCAVITCTMLASGGGRHPCSTARMQAL